jgi:hypothetical protein
MYFSVNMKQFRSNWIWNADTVAFGDQIAKTDGKFFTLRGNTYKRLLTDFDIFFTAL